MSANEQVARYLAKKAAEQSASKKVSFHFVIDSSRDKIIEKEMKTKKGKNCLVVCEREVDRSIDRSIDR